METRSSINGEQGKKLKKIKGSREHVSPPGRGSKLDVLMHLAILLQFLINFMKEALFRPHYVLYKSKQRTESISNVLTVTQLGKAKQLTISKNVAELKLGSNLN